MSEGVPTMVKKLHRRRRSSAALVGALAVIVALGGVVAAGAQATAQGNSENAKACKKGGWENLVRSDGTAFASQGECVSYAAGGGVLQQPNLCNKQALAAAGLSEPANPNYILGTSGDDDFTGRMTDGNDVVCGFAGNDGIEDLEGYDIFLGGDGVDRVGNMSGGTFEGGAGNDDVGTMHGGTFNGGAGNDDVGTMHGGTFNGGAGSDHVGTMHGGTFNGGDGNDRVDVMVGGEFNGGDGIDVVEVMMGGEFNGGDGIDFVTLLKTGGTCSGVESGC